MIISFAWTTPAVVIGQKTETRRDWSPKTFAMIKKAMDEGRLVDAWDKSPRFGGKEFGKVRILNLVEAEDSRTIPEGSWQKEGFHVLTMLEAKIGKSSPIDVWEFWKNENDQDQVVVTFEVVSLNDHGQTLKEETMARIREIDKRTEEAQKSGGGGL